MVRFTRSILFRAVSILIAFVFFATTACGQLLLAPATALAAAGTGSSGSPAGDSQGSPAQATPVQSPPASKPKPPTVVRELLEKKTDSSDSYLMSDGSIQAKLYSGPVQFKDESGTWRAVDDSLVLGASPGDVVPAAMPLSERFGNQNAAHPAAELSTKDWSVGLDLIDATDNGHVALGDTVHYPGVATDTELEYQASASGMKDTLVLSSPNAPTTFSFFLSLGKLRVETIPGAGTGLFAAGADRPTLTLGKLRVFDSSNPASGTAVCADANVSVSDAPGGAILTYTIPKDWLASPDRVFPVKVDPSIGLSTADDTYIHSINNLGEQDYNHEMYAGWDPDDGECYSLIWFDTAPLEGAVIDSATLSLDPWDGVVGAPQVIARNTSAWDDDIIYSDGVPSSTIITSATLPAAGPMRFTVTSAVQDWCKGAGLQQGFQIYSPRPHDPTTFAGYGTSEADESDERPVLTVSYPAPQATSATGTVSPLSWYTGSGPDDAQSLGRGQVSLSWPSVPKATGYKIMAFDGSAYRQVGDVIGTAATTWTSASSGLFPGDSTIAGMPANNTANAFVGAATPGGTSMISTGTVTDSSLSAAGIVLSDGTYLYVLRYFFMGGPTTWHKIGTGYGGTTKGRDYGTVGSDLSSRWSRSAFLLGGVLWNGFTDQPTQLEGYPLNATSNTPPSYMSFSKPLLDYWTGAERTGSYSGSVMVAADSGHVYSASVSLSSGDDNSGFRVRVYDDDGNWIADHDIPMRSYAIDGLISDGTSLYFIDSRGDDGALVTKVRLSDFTVENQFTLNESNGAGPGCFDTTNNCFWLGREWDACNIYRYQASGLDLRDDPRPLYSKMSSAATMGADPRYDFKVVPYNADALADINACATATVELPKRSVTATDDPRHAVADLGEIGTGQAAANLDAGVLTLSNTDLSADSYGPDASLERSYSSTSTATGKFGFGWRFGFERNLSIDATGATYLDEDRDAHRFTKSGSAYLSPFGDYESLIATSAPTMYGTATYELIHADRRSFALFSGSGVLLAEVDKNGNATSYNVGASEVDITAANGNRIVLSLPGGGQATATYSEPVSGGIVTRQVAYSFVSNGNNATGTAVYTFSDTSTSTPTPGYTLTYVYTSSRLTHVTESQAAGIANQPTNTSAIWDVGYDGSGRLSTITAPYYSATQRAVTTVTYGTDAGGLAKATLTQTGEVSGQVKSLSQDFGINPSKTLSYKTNPYASGDMPAYTRYEYSPNEDELWEQSPDAAFKYWSYDPAGNVLTETDEVGRATTHSYDAQNDEISSTDPGGSVTNFAYDQYGDRTSLTKTLNAAQTACTLDSYDAHGRQTLERRELYVEANGTQHWATTASTYGSGDGFPDPTETDRYGETSANGVSFSNENVDLGTGVANGPAQLAERATFDALGNRLTSTDASNFTTVNVYDAAGRVLASTDASGLASVSVFDGLGRAVGSYQRANASVIGYKTSTIDPFDRTIVASTWRTSGATSTAVLDHTDTYAYDARGTQQSQINSLISGQPQVDQHDAVGDTTAEWAAGLSATQDANSGYASRTTFDAEGQEVAASAPGTMTAASTTTYTPDGNVATETVPDHTTISEYYDSAGNNATETVSNGQTTLSNFDVSGRATVTTETGLATSYTYDLANRQTGAQAAGRQLSSTTYNSQDWVLSTTDADGMVTTYVYDASGRVVAQTFAAQGSQPKTTTTSYDALGRMLSKTDPDGRIETDTYDAFGRLAEQRLKASSGATAKDTRTAYDSLSRSVGSTDAVSGLASTWTYPTTFGGATKTAVTNAGITTTTTVDANGNELSRATAGSGFSSFTRSITATDSAGRIVAWMLSGTSGQRAFDFAGRETTQSGTGFSGSATYTYNSDGRKSGEYLPQASPGGADTEGYTYDANGRLIGTTASGAAAGSFAYDAAGDVATFTAPVNVSGAATSGVLEYDGAGRLADRRVSGSIATVYAFDSHGWRVSQGPAANPSSIVFSYTGQGGLKSYDTSSGVHAAYTFDATGQRTGSVVTSGSLTTTTSYVYSGIALQSLAATSTNGSSVSTWTIAYLYDADGHPYAGVYSASDASPTVFSITTDDRGDVIGLADANGSSFAAYRYDAWGRPLSVATQTVGVVKVADIAARQPLRYAGYAYDAESGTYYLSARTYDPGTMQFLTKDPVKSDGEESAYQYCGGDPVGKTDPSGLATRWIKTSSRRVSYTSDWDEWDEFFGYVYQGEKLWAAIEYQWRTIQALWKRQTYYTHEGWEYDGATEWRFDHYENRIRFGVFDKDKKGHYHLYRVLWTSGWTNGRYPDS